MANELQIFTHPQFGEIRAVEIDGEPWFIASDICKALTINNISDAISRLESDEATLVLIEGSRNGVPINAVSEAGLYRLVLGSRKKEANAFKRWVVHEVLPSIRKHGAYLTPQVQDQILNNPDLLISLATKIKEEQTRNRILMEENTDLRAQNDVMKPKALFADSVSVSESDCTVGAFAKILRQNGVQIGRNRLFEWLRDNGYIMRDGQKEKNIPTQKSMEMGIFRVKETTIHNGDEVFISYTTYITGKGQTYFLNRFLGGEISA